MKPPSLLRTAAVVALVQFVAHTFLLVSYVPAHGPAEIAVVEAMRAHRFDFGGFTPHSYWDMYLGYGLFAAFTCLIEAVLFWHLATVARTNSAWTRPLVALFLVGNLGYAVLVALYFFPVPLVADLIIATCLGLVLWKAPPGRAPAAP